MVLAPGTKAPEFKLKTTPDPYLALSDFEGRPRILTFYPADWSHVCGDQLALYNECLPEFNRFNAQVLAISCDAPWCHVAYAEQRRIRFPLLSDFWPHGQTSKEYEAFLESDGESQRALFVVDEQGTIRWSYRSPLGVNPGVDGILNALENLYPEKASHGEAQHAH